MASIVTPGTYSKGSVLPSGPGGTGGFVSAPSGSSSSQQGTGGGSSSQGSASLPPPAPSYVQVGKNVIDLSRSNIDYSKPSSFSSGGQTLAIEPTRSTFTGQTGATGSVVTGATMTLYNTPQTQAPGIPPTQPTYAPSGIIPTLPTNYAQLNPQQQTAALVNWQFANQNLLQAAYLKGEVQAGRLAPQTSAKTGETTYWTVPTAQQAGPQPDTFQYDLTETRPSNPVFRAGQNLMQGISMGLYNIPTRGWGAGSSPVSMGISILGAGYALGAKSMNLFSEGFKYNVQQRLADLSVDTTSQGYGQRFAQNFGTAYKATFISGTPGFATGYALMKTEGYAPFVVQTGERIASFSRQYGLNSITVGLGFTGAITTITRGTGLAYGISTESSARVANFERLKMQTSDVELKGYYTGQQAVYGIAGGAAMIFRPDINVVALPLGIAASVYAGGATKMQALKGYSAGQVAMKAVESAVPIGLASYSVIANKPEMAGMAFTMASPIVFQTGLEALKNTRFIYEIPSGAKEVEWSGDVRVRTALESERGFVSQNARVFEQKGQMIHFETPENKIAWMGVSFELPASGKSIQFGGYTFGKGGGFSIGTPKNINLGASRFDIGGSLLFETTTSRDIAKANWYSLTNYYDPITGTNPLADRALLKQMKSDFFTSAVGVEKTTRTSPTKVFRSPSDVAVAEGSPTAVSKALTFAEDRSAYIYGGIVQVPQLKPGVNRPYFGAQRNPEYTIKLPYGSKLASGDFNVASRPIQTGDIDVHFNNLITRRFVERYASYVSEAKGPITKNKVLPEDNKIQFFRAGQEEQALNKLGRDTGGFYYNYPPKTETFQVASGQGGYYVQNVASGNKFIDVKGLGLPAGSEVMPESSLGFYTRFDTTPMSFTRSTGKTGVIQGRVLAGEGGSYSQTIFQLKQTGPGRVGFMPREGRELDVPRYLVVKAQQFENMGIGSKGAARLEKVARLFPKELVNMAPQFETAHFGNTPPSAGPLSAGGVDSVISVRAFGGMIETSQTRTSPRASPKMTSVTMPAYITGFQSPSLPPGSSPGASTSTSYTIEQTPYSYTPRSRGYDFPSPSPSPVPGPSPYVPVSPPSPSPYSPYEPVSPRITITPMGGLPGGFSMPTEGLRPSKLKRKTKYQPSLVALGEGYYAKPGKRGGYKSTREGRLTGLEVRPIIPMAQPRARGLSKSLIGGGIKKYKKGGLF